MRVYREKLDDQIINKKATDLEILNKEKEITYGLIGPYDKLDRFEQKMAKRTKGKKLQADL